MSKGMQETVTSPDYWDCGCDENYIQPSDQRYCIWCGAFRDDQPDSRQDEIDKMELEEGARV